MRNMIVVGALLVAPLARAQDASFEVVDAKLTSAVADKEAVDDKGASPPAAKAFIWLKLKPTGEPTMQIRWSVNGTAIWMMDPVPVKLGRTWYSKTLDVGGAWKAEILGAGDTVAKTLEFTVTGEPMARAAEPSAAPAAAAGAARGHGVELHVEVVELKLATSIDAKTREPVDPGSSFANGSKVYAWLVLNVKEAEAQVRLRWSVNGGEPWTADAISVKESPTWHTWGYKTMTGTGSWKVEVLDAEDKVIHTTEFTAN